MERKVQLSSSVIGEEKHLHPVELILNSDYRARGDNNNPEFDFPNITNIKAYSVQSVVIPETYYCVNSNNNVLTIADTTPSNYDITLTSGNYDISELTTELETQLNASACAGTFTCSYNINTGKMTYTNSSEATTIDSTSSAYTLLGKMMPLTTHVTHTSSQSVDLAGSKMVHIRCLGLTSNSRAKTYIALTANGSMTNQDLLLSYPLKLTATYTLTKSDDETIRVPCDIQNLSNLTLQLLDDDFNTLDLNGIPFVITIILWVGH
jgi:hypothetical protein